MSLNIRKAKTINNFISKLSKPKKAMNNIQKNKKINNKDFIQKESLMNYLQSFLTPRRPTLLKQNLLLNKNKNNKNYYSTLQTKNELRSPSNNSINNKSKNDSLFDSKSKILFRNNNTVNRISSLKYKNNLKQLFFKTNNHDNYSKQLLGFSPSNRYRLMKIYQSLKYMNSPRIKYERNSDNFGNDEFFNSEFNLNSKNNIDIKKEKKSELMNVKEVNNYTIQNVNSLQFSNIKKEHIKKNIVNLKAKIETRNKNDFDKNKADNIFSQNNIPFIKESEKIINDNKIDLPRVISDDINNYTKKNNEEKADLYLIKDEINYKIKDKEKEVNANKENEDKYNKINVMEKCLNRLFFDYSDGNYVNSNNYKYKNDDNQENNIIINKEIMNKREEKYDIDDKNNIKFDDLIDDKTINDLNQISNNSQTQNLDNNIENKENINTENLKNTKDIFLSLDNEILNDNINNNIKKESKNPKHIELNYGKNKDKNNLNDENKINLNLNYLYENKNYVNIQLLNYSRNYNKNPKKINSLKRSVHNNSKLRNEPKENLELILDKIPKHDNASNLPGSHSTKHSTNNYKSLRRSKIIEFINKNSAIMPPNDYQTPTNHLVYSFQ